MNENQKNIETCLPEDILAEVANVPTDAQFRSLVEESFDPLQQQAVEQAGSDAYEQVVQSHKPYTFTSTIVQMKSNLILLLRRLWRFPFGSGTLRSLADMWQHYITRLSGNETYGIPSRLDQLTALPSAPLLLADRKISNGGAEDGIVDGISFARLLSDPSVIENVQHIVDTNDATYDMRSKSVFQYINADFVLRCKRILGTGLHQGFIPTTANDTVFLDLEEIEGGGHYRLFAPGNNKIKKVYAPKFKGFTYATNYEGIIAQSTSLEEFYAPSFERIYMNGGGEAYTEFRNNTKLWKVVLGKLTQTGTGGEFGGCPNLIHLEIGEGTDVNVKFSTTYGYEWSPTNALDASRTDLIEEGSTAENNLQQFLQNFHDYIAERLATFPEGTTDKTLTLSAAVYSAIWDNNGDPLPTTICQEIDTIIVDTKHWRPNKAS